MINCYVYHYDQVMFAVNTKYIQLKEPINIVQCNMQWIKDIV